MMPQKKNRTRWSSSAARPAGWPAISPALLALKGLPLYNRDLQETQEAPSTRPTRRGVARRGGGSRRGPGTRPEVSSLPRSGVACHGHRRGSSAGASPSRDAHDESLVGRNGPRIRTDLRRVAGADSVELRPFLRRLTPESSVARRDVVGGTSPRRVRSALVQARRRLRPA
jgi:hypothetical protein